MSYNFPNSPTPGQTFSVPGGPSWKWTGVAWTQHADANGMPIDVSDSMVTATGSSVTRTLGDWMTGFGAFTAAADAPVSGYITIKDINGVTRKIAVII